MTIDYLLIGHITADLTPQGEVAGGTALYSALTVQRLGRSVGIVTRAANPQALDALLPGIRLHVLPTERSTTFENRYRDDARQQRIHHVAAPIQPDEVPDAWRDAAIVHLAPVAQELPQALLHAFPRSCRCATPQGWLRAWDAAGRVRYQPLDAAGQQLGSLDAMVLSPEDVGGDQAALDALIRAVPLVVVTRAGAGATIHQGGQQQHIPAFPSRVVDATGAGDVFAAAFFCEWQSGCPAVEAAIFAHAVASIAIGGLGSSTIPERAQVDEALARWRADTRLPKPSRLV